MMSCGIPESRVNLSLEGNASCVKSSSLSFPSREPVSKVRK